MKTFNTNIAKMTEAVNAYVATLKYGSAFKYVKGLTPSQRTLANICLSRQNAGQVLELTNGEMEAFGMKPSNGKGMAFTVGMTPAGKVSIFPQYEI